MTESCKLGDRAQEWWRDYMEPAPRRRGAARAAMARLRRAASPMEALMEPATLDLARRLGRTGEQELARVGILAAVLAHVRETDNRAVARAAGPPQPTADPGKDDEEAVLKYGRFRRLLQADDDDLLDQMRRLVHLLGNRAKVSDLACSILFWGDRMRRRWVLGYYGLDARTPADTPAEPSNAE